MSRVPAEFLGQARALRAEIAAADPIAHSAAERVAAPLCARLRRKPTLRPDSLADAERHWRDWMPAAGRLDREARLDNRSLTIEETRASAANFRADGWGAGREESGLCIVSLMLEAAPGRVRLNHEVLTYISLHALARRFERGAPGAALADLRALGEWCAAPGAAGAEFRVPAGDGWWVGNAAEVERGGEVARMLAVRTFLSQ